MGSGAPTALLTALLHAAGRGFYVGFGGKLDGLSPEGFAVFAVGIARVNEAGQRVWLKTFDGGKKPESICFDAFPGDGAVLGYRDYSSEPAKVVRCDRSGQVLWQQELSVAGEDVTLHDLVAMASRTVLAVADWATSDGTHLLALHRDGSVTDIGPLPGEFPHELGLQTHDGRRLTTAGVRDGQLVVSRFEPGGSIEWSATLPPVDELAGATWDGQVVVGTDGSTAVFGRLPSAAWGSKRSLVAVWNTAGWLRELRYMYLGASAPQAAVTSAGDMFTATDFGASWDYKGHITLWRHTTSPLETLWGRSAIAPGAAPEKHVFSLTVTAAGPQAIGLLANAGGDLRFVVTDGFGSTLAADTDACCGTEAGACADEDPCTSDFCGAGGCQTDVSIPVPSAVPDICSWPTGCCCDDGDPCTAPDTCDDGTCIGEPLTCDDGDQCTTDACIPGDGSCTHAIAGGLPCDDGNPCTTADECDGPTGACLGTALPNGLPCPGGSCKAGVCSP